LLPGCREATGWFHNGYPAKEKGGKIPVGALFVHVYHVLAQLIGIYERVVHKLRTEVISQFPKSHHPRMSRSENVSIVAEREIISI
jgi:hypothetical protein